VKATKDDDDIDVGLVLPQCTLPSHAANKCVFMFFHFFNTTAAAASAASKIFSTQKLNLLIMLLLLLNVFWLC